MTRSNNSDTRCRLSREEWLQNALDVLEQEGGGRLTIDELVKRLGVSRGSFYWHFRGRTDFVRSLVEYWSEIFTQKVAIELENFPGSAAERLLALAMSIANSNLTQYDLAIRAWAANDSVAADGVRKVDQYRTEYVRSLFKEIGFKGDELDVRTHTFVVFYSMQPSIYAGLSTEEQLRHIKLRHAILVEPNRQ